MTTKIDYKKIRSFLDSTKLKEETKDYDMQLIQLLQNECEMNNDYSELATLNKIIEEIINTDIKDKVFVGFGCANCFKSIKYYNTTLLRFRNRLNSFSQTQMKELSTRWLERCEE